MSDLVALSQNLHNAVYFIIDWIYLSHYFFTLNRNSYDLFAVKTTEITAHYFCAESKWADEKC